MAQPNFPQWEKEIAAFWKENNTFEKSVASRPQERPYVFYDGPPFATGLPHYGHILASTIKDAIPRYHTMKGSRVERRWGWDCHGLPIEAIVEEQLKISGKKQIEEIGIDTFNNTCRNNVLTYAKEWSKMVERIGRWVDFENSYKTMDSTYMESVWWAVQQIHEKGLLYEGRKVLLYCTRCETPVSKFEVSMDNSYKDVTEEAAYVAFKVRSSPHVLPDNTFIIAWTTTPWTLPGNVALAVGAEIPYVLAKQGDRYLIVARERMGVLGDNYEVVDTFSGADLVGTEYEPLFELPALRATGKRSHYVAAADFVTATDGTGVVHTAVVYGEDDYNLGVQLDLPIVPLLTPRGEFNESAPELVRGHYFKEAQKLIKDDLASRGLLYKKEQNTHSYPFCWRCSTPLIYNAIPAWFINIQKIKPRLIELKEKMNWYPDHLKNGRFQHTMESAPDWNISRNRYWATPLPIWKCDTAQCTGITIIGSLAQLHTQATNYDEVYASRDIKDVDLHRPYIDRVTLRCEQCGAHMHRITEVIDCWVEAGSMPFAAEHYPFENKEIFESRFPAQFVAEYIAQTRTWFFFMHVMSTVLFDTIPMEHIVTTGTVLNEKGEKMSKSKRNFPDPWELVDRYGADALRWYLTSSVVMNAEDLFFSEREVDEVYKKVMLIYWNVVEFLQLYTQDGQLAGGKIAGTGHVLDRWIITKLDATIVEVTKAMDGYNTVLATRLLREFVNELSTWYVRRSRDRFKSHDADAPAAAATLRHVVMTTAKLMAPFVPFLAEKVYQTLGGEKESIHLEDWPQSGSLGRESYDGALLEQMGTARTIVELGLSIRAAQKIRIRQPLSELLYEGATMPAELESIIADELNVKAVSHGAVVAGNESTVAEHGSIRVALITKMTEELRQEGMARELIRAINEARKQQGFTIADTAVLTVSYSSPWMQQALERHREDIQSGARATMILQQNESSEGIAFVSPEGNASFTIAK